MKQATGELNMTIVVVVAVGVLAAFFYTTIWPMLRNNFIANSKCSNAVCDPSTVDENGMAECNTYKKNGEIDIKDLKCVWKG